jgi:hypothetical protein
MIKEIEEIFKNVYYGYDTVKGYDTIVGIEKASKQLLIWHLEKQRELIKVIYEAWDTNKRELCRGIDKDLSEQIEELKK